MRLASPLDIRVVIPLDSGDTFVALAFPLRHRVLLVPGVEQLRLLAGKVEIVTVTHIEIGAGNAAAQNEDYNVVNGDVFRWKWMWQQIADYFGIEAAPFPGEMQPLEGRMLAAEDDWRQIAQKYQLRESDVARLASWWHTDADLGRPMEVFTDISKSRNAGFTGYRSTREAFFALFDKLKENRIIPS